MKKYGDTQYKWDNTITCRSCGMKKHIGINEGMDNLERMALIIHEEKKARCCKSPDYAMYPEGD